MLMAGLDGIRNRIDPGDPTDADIYELSPEEAANIPSVPTSMEEAVAALGMRWTVGKAVSRRSLRGLRPLAKGGS